MVSPDPSQPNFYILTGSALAGNLVWAHEEARQFFDGLADLVVRLSFSFLLDEELFASNTCPRLWILQIAQISLWG